MVGAKWGGQRTGSKGKRRVNSYRVRWWWWWRLDDSAVVVVGGGGRHNTGRKGNGRVRGISTARGMAVVALLKVVVGVGGGHDNW